MANLDFHRVSFAVTRSSVHYLASCAVCIFGPFLLNDTKPSLKSCIQSCLCLPIPYPPRGRFQDESPPPSHIHAYIHSAQSSKMSFPKALNGVSDKPGILLCGDIVLAHEEWESLRAIADLKVHFYRPRKLHADARHSNSTKGVATNFYRTVEVACSKGLSPYPGHGIPPK